MHRTKTSLQTAGKMTQGAGVYISQARAKEQHCPITVALRVRYDSDSRWLIPHLPFKARYPGKSCLTDRHIRLTEIAGHSLRDIALLKPQ